MTAKKTSRTKKGGNKISPKKLKMRDDLVKLIKDNSTFVIASIKSIPSSQLQKIRHKLKKVAGIMIVKKHVMKRAMDEAAKLPGEAKLKELEKYLEEGSAVIFARIDPFELASILADERTPVKAKAGQTAIQDIEIEAGPTDMPAGPMITYLSNAGIKIAIEGGKISIKEPKVLVRKDEKISGSIAEILSKMEILPFTVGLEPIAVFDAKTHSIHVGIKIDKKATLENLKKTFSDSRALALAINYPAAEIIKMIIAKAAMQEKAIAELIKAEEPKPAEAEQAEAKENTVEQQGKEVQSQDNAQPEDKPGNENKLLEKV